MNFDLILNVLMLVCGLYVFYTVLKLRIGKTLFKNSLLVPNDKQPSDCLDEPGYIAYLTPRLLVVAFFTTASGIVYLLNDLLPQPLLPYPWSLIQTGVVLAVLVWYAFVNRRANRDYFGN